MTDLPPGRELDALIAERVMKCKVKRGYTWSPEKPDYDCGCPGLAHMTDRGDLMWFSADMGAAWEVVKVMTSRDEDLEFNLEPGKTDNGVAVTFFSPRDLATVCGPFYVARTTMPHAICLAALNAVDR